MNPPRLASGSLHHHGAHLLPDDLEGVDCLLLDGGPVAAPEEEGPDELLDEAIRRLAPTLYLDPRLRVIASLAGRDPEAAACRVGAILSKAGNADLPIGVAYGSDVLDRIEEFIAAGEELRDNQTHQRFAELTKPAVAAAIELDGEPLAAALASSPRLIMAGGLGADAVTQAIVGAGADQPSRTTLRIVYRAGHIASALVRVGDTVSGDVSATLESAWRSLLDEDSLPTRAALVTRYREIDEHEASVVAYASYEHDRFDDAESALRLLLRASANLGNAGLAVVRFPAPAVAPRYETWSTSISTGLVEWSVDVRPAKDWVE